MLQEVLAHIIANGATIAMPFIIVAWVGIMVGETTCFRQGQRKTNCRAAAEALPQDNASVEATVLERFHHLSDFGVRDVHGSVRSGMVRELHFCRGCE